MDPIQTEAHLTTLHLPPPFGVRCSAFDVRISSSLPLITDNGQPTTLPLLPPFDVGRSMFNVRCSPFLPVPNPMPNDVVISVENLSKSYLIGHDGPQEEELRIDHSHVLSAT